MKKKNYFGFTVVEVLIVIAIIALIALMWKPTTSQKRYDEALAARHKAICVENLRKIEKVKSRWNVGGKLPSTEEFLKGCMPAPVPECPSGGRYNVEWKRDKPTCSFEGHVLVDPLPKTHNDSATNR